jgi:hypothetical protein
MREKHLTRPPRGTHPELLRAANNGAVAAVLIRRSWGEPDEVIRRMVITRFYQGIVGDEFDEYARETLMATVQRAVERALS